MTKKTRPTFSPEFRLETAPLVVDQNYTHQEAAKAMGVGYAPAVNGLNNYRSVDVRLPEQLSLIESVNQSNPKHYSVTLLCEVFEVYGSFYKYWLIRDESLCPERIKLVSEVRLIHRESNGSAGVRTIAGILSTRGFALSRYRAGRLMKTLACCQIPKHAYKKATREHVEIPNLLNRQFAVTQPTQVWCGDVTFIWMGHRWAYLSVVLNLFARKPVGWAMSLSPDSQLTMKALTMAFERRGKPKDVMFHTDQGSHYTSKKFRQLVWRYQLTQA
jgi:putative transposase